MCLDFFAFFGAATFPRGFMAAFCRVTVIFGAAFFRRNNFAIFLPFLLLPELLAMSLRL